MLTGILVGGIDPTNGNLKTGRPSWPTAESLRPGTCANLHPREIVRLGSVLLPEGKVRHWGGIAGMIFETVKKWCICFGGEIGGKWDRGTHWDPNFFHHFGG